MGLLEVLQKYLDDEEAKDPEIIAGTDIRDVLDSVDLSRFIARYGITGLCAKEGERATGTARNASR